MQNLIATTFEVVHYIALQAVHYKPLQEVHLSRYNQTILHDICKSDRFWFKGRDIRQHAPKCEIDGKHSIRSIIILKGCGLKLTGEEYRAIRWHMKGANYHSRNKKKWKKIILEP